MSELAVTRSFLDAVHVAGVSYCHWKSNFHITESLAGIADLDLLIDARHQQLLEHCLENLPALHMVNIGPKWLPGLEDWLLLDEETGTLVHLHIHYRLVLGEQKAKNHHLPIEEFVLNHTTSLDGVKVPAAEVELLLLFVRSLVKSTNRMCIRTLLGRKMSPFPDAIGSELVWLLDQCSDADVMSALERSGLQLDPDLLSEYLRRGRSDALSPAFVLRARRSLLRSMRPYLRGPRLWSISRKLHLRFRFSRVATRIKPVPAKRTVGPATYTAIVGADGSGKSTLVRDLAKWGGKKLDSRQVFNGQPKRDPVVMALRRIDQKLRSRRKSGDEPTWAAGVLWVRVARYRRSVHDQARSLTSKGISVVSDRYPARELWDMAIPMDGPRLQHKPDRWRSRILRLLAVQEFAAYDHISAPDLAILLSGSLETLSARKPDTPRDQHRAKVDAISKLAASGRYPVIDAEQPYHEVLLQAKRLYFSSLVERQRSGQVPANLTAVPVQ